MESKYCTMCATLGIVYESGFAENVSWADELFASAQCGYAHIGNPPPVARAMACRTHRPGTFADHLYASGNVYQNVYLQGQTPRATFQNNPSRRSGHGKNVWMPGIGVPMDILLPFVRARGDEFPSSGAALLVATANDEADIVALFIMRMRRENDRYWHACTYSSLRVADMVVATVTEPQLVLCPAMHAGFVHHIPTLCDRMQRCDILSATTKWMAELTVDALEHTRRVECAVLQAVLAHPSFQRAEGDGHLFKYAIRRVDIVRVLLQANVHPIHMSVRVDNDWRVVGGHNPPLMMYSYDSPLFTCGPEVFAAILSADHAVYGGTLLTRAVSLHVDPERLAMLPGPGPNTRCNMFHQTPLEYYVNGKMNEPLVLATLLRMKADVTTAVVEKACG